MAAAAKPAAVTAPAKVAERPQKPKAAPTPERQAPAPSQPETKSAAREAAPAAPATPPPVAKAKPAAKPAAKPTPDPEKVSKNKLPVVDIKAKDDGEEVCVARFGDMGKQESEVLAPLLKSGTLATNWRSPRGAAFSLNSHGPITVTLNSLPPATIKALASADFSEDIVRGALESGVVSFNAQVCRKGDTFGIKLVGAGPVTGGRSGYLALVPNKNGFTANGEISGSKFHESFTATASAH